MIQICFLCPKGVHVLMMYLTDWASHGMSAWTVSRDCQQTAVCACIYALSADSLTDCLYADPYVNDATFTISMLTLEELGATGNKVNIVLLTCWPRHSSFLVQALAHHAAATVKRDLTLHRADLICVPDLHSYCCCNDAAVGGMLTSSSG